MAQRRNAFSLVDLLIVIVVIALLAALLLPALGKTREMARRSKCGKNANQLSVAQQNYATSQNQKGQPESFVRGTEGFCRPDKMPLKNGTQLTDGSRAMTYLAKQNFIDSFAGYACPSDPFVAVLDTPGSNLRMDDVDFPTENKPVGLAWAARNSPAGTETGHTYYSYSMQAGSPDVQINTGVKMLATLPLFSERNPWSEVLPTLTGSDPTANGYANGNAWNHNREGQSTSQRDGSTFFLPDARDFAIPASPANGAQGTYDYIYSDEALKAVNSQEQVSTAGKKYVGVGADQTPRSPESKWGCYMFD